MVFPLTARGHKELLLLEARVQMLGSTAKLNQASSDPAKMVRIPVSIKQQRPNFWFKGLDAVLIYHMEDTELPGPQTTRFSD